jgi:hypothetical protein
MIYSVYMPYVKYIHPANMALIPVDLIYWYFKNLTGVYQTRGPLSIDI